MRHMELIPDDLQCASVLLFMLLLLIVAFLAGAYLAFPADQSPLWNAVGR